jgi:hypothetical protein
LDPDATIKDLGIGSIADLEVASGVVVVVQLDPHLIVAVQQNVAVGQRRVRLDTAIIGGRCPAKHQVSSCVAAAASVHGSARYSVVVEVAAIALR